MNAPALRWEAVHTSTVTTVWVDGLRFDITITTEALFAALAAGDLSAVLPGSLPLTQQHAWYNHLLDADTDFDMPDAKTVTEAVVEELCGVPAETALRLAAFLTADWLLLDGHHLAGGLDLLSLAPRRLCAVLYAHIVEHRYEERSEADALLFPPRTTYDPVSDGDGFTAALALAGSMPGIEA